MNARLIKQKFLWILGAVLGANGVFAAEINFDSATIGNINIYPRGEKIGAFEEKTVLNGKDAMRIDFNCSSGIYFQFSFPFKNQVEIKNAKKIVIAVDIFLPENNKVSRINLRLTDKDGETFQYRKPFAAGAQGWIVLKYEIDSFEKQQESWGQKNKVNKAFDWPIRLHGFSIAYNSSQGTGYVGFGKIKITTN